jgi:hypothetical protein
MECTETDEQRNKGTGTYQPIILCNVTAKSVKTKILGVFGLLWAGFEGKMVHRALSLPPCRPDSYRDSNLNLQGYVQQADKDQGPADPGATKSGSNSNGMGTHLSQ